MGYYSVLIPMIDFKFNFMQTKFAMLAVSRPIACRFGNREYILSVVNFEGFE